jgi:hypothetical protein
MYSGFVEVVLFTLIVVSGTGGELCVSRAMKHVGEVHDFRPRAIVSSCGPCAWAGCGPV